METSAWQAAKFWVQGQTGLERDTIHYLIGLTLLLAALAISRTRVSVHLWALVAAVALGCGMEVFDLRDDLAALGVARWRVSALDVARTAVFPALGVIAVAVVQSVRGAGQGR